MAKRGLFQSIFGGKSEKNKDFHAYKLLSSWESTFVPYSGNMWDINTVRSAVDAFARRASTAQPRHVRQSAETTVAVNDYIDRILQFRPNPYMTAADFYYKLAAQYKVYNNAIAYPVFDETGRLTAVYPINAQYFELLEYMGTLYCRFTFATGATYICEYSRIIHVRRHFLEHDIFGDGNKPLDTALKTANTLNQSMSKFAELVAVIRGILKVSNAVKTEDLNRRRDDFIRDNLRMENNGAGVIVTDAKYDYTPITDKTTPIPATQLAYVKEEIYDYLGVSKEIVENTATPQQEQAFYSGEIAPFFRRLSQAFSNVLFTEREFVRKPYRLFRELRPVCDAPGKGHGGKVLDGNRRGDARPNLDYVRYADHRRRGGRAPRPNAEHGKRKARRQIPDRRKYAAGRHYAARGANRRERGGLGYGYQTGARVSRFAGL